MRSSLTTLAVVVALAGCQSPIPDRSVSRKIEAELASAAQPRPKAVVPESVTQALIPPLSVEAPTATTPVEPRFDVSVKAAPADQVLTAIVSGTRYSMLVHPDIKEPMSLNLKEVTLKEALDAMRELYGFEYKVDGTRIYVQPASLQSHVFRVHYLAGRRAGRAEVRVSSGSIQAPVSPPTAPATGAPASPPLAPGASASLSLESSRVTTSSDNDFWGDLRAAIIAIIGSEAGRSVIVNAHSGVIMVRAFPKELRAVEEYLKATSLMVERQVMLEAKIIEVSLSDQFATGINWAAFGGNNRIAASVINPGTTLRADGSLISPTLNVDPSSTRPQQPDPLIGIPGSIGSVTRRFSGAPGAVGSVFGLAFQSSSFAALLTFLETQGRVHVLSSPRIAALNNQKAVIKVGTDEFFVTSVETTTVATLNTSTVSPKITTQPFFSGIALDVTPQISDDDQITLHVHPSVSSVTDKTKQLDLGALGSFTLPLASSSINESDTIVRVRDGTIAAIGGLMRQQQASNRAGLPGSGQTAVVRDLFGNRSEQLVKSELVILLKVTIIRGDETWHVQAQELNQRMQVPPLQPGKRNGPSEPLGLNHR